MGRLSDRYRFILVQDGATETLVYPALSNFTKKFESDSDNSLLYEDFIDGEITFCGRDFEIFMEIDETNDCPDLVLRTEVLCDGSWQELVSTRITTNEATFDYDECEVKFEKIAENNIVCLKSTWNTEKNLLSFADTRQIRTRGPGALNTVTDFETVIGERDFVLQAPRHANESVRFSDNWAPVTTQIDVIGQTVQGDGSILYDVQIETQWCRQERTRGCLGGVPIPPPGGNWIMVSNDCATLNSASWVRRPDYTLTNADVTTNPTQWLFEYRSITKEGPTFPNGISLEEAFRVLNDCGFNIVSNFLNINPDGTAPSDVYYDWAADHLSNLHLIPKSDAKNPTATQSAIIANLSLRRLLVGLNATVQTEWTLDGNTLRIEFPSYFSSDGIDLTAEYPTCLEGTNTVSSSIEGIPIRETFQFADTTRPEFDGEDITYNTNCADPDNTIEYKAEDWTTDIASIFFGTVDIDDNGFALVQTEPEPGVTINPEYFLTVYPATGFFNGSLAYPVLHEELWEYDRYLMTGTMNNQNRSFASRKPYREQDPIIVTPFCCSDILNFNPSIRMRSGIGWGKVVEASYSAQARCLEVKLIH